MLFQGTLIAVSDMDRAKKFYGEIMEQKVMMDLGVHVSFERGLSLQSNYEELVGVKLDMKPNENNFQLYFEVEDLKSWQTKIEQLGDIEFLHKAKEYPWGQKVMRFYDYDRHIVEVAESMDSVGRRFLSEGLSVEETAERMMSPVEYIQTLV